MGNVGGAPQKAVQSVLPAPSVAQAVAALDVIDRGRPVGLSAAAGRAKGETCVQVMSGVKPQLTPRRGVFQLRQHVFDERAGRSSPTGQGESGATKQSDADAAVSRRWQPSFDDVLLLLLLEDAYHLLPQHGARRPPCRQKAKSCLCRKKGSPSLSQPSPRSLRRLWCFLCVGRAQKLRKRDVSPWCLFAQGCARRRDMRRDVTILDTDVSHSSLFEHMFGGSFWTSRAKTTTGLQFPPYCST